MTASTCVSLAATLILGIGVTAAQQVVYPLHLGDRWQYTGGGWGTPRNMSISRDSIMPNGHRYFRLADSVHSWSRWERTVANQVFQYDPWLAAEFLWYDFSLPPGAVVNVFFNGYDTTTIVVSSRGSHELFGMSRRYWSFFVDRNPHGYDDEEAVQITDSIGLTDMTVSQGFSAIRGAIVGGRQYGTITTVLEPSPINSAGIHLRQNYPNPFNASTIIVFESSSTTHARLVVFDVLGRELAVLVDQVVNQGSYQIDFQCSSLPSGMYFYRLLADQYSMTRKFVVQR